MANKTFQKYQTLFKIQKTDENGDVVKSMNESGQMRVQYIDAPSVDLIPDWMHRNVTESIMRKLESDGQVRFSDIEQEMGTAFIHCRIDYIKRWIEGYSETQQGQAIELIYVNSKYWTAGKGESRADDLEVAQSYLSVNGKDKKGWVASSEGEEGNEQITRARISWQVSMAGKLLGHVHDKLAIGSGKKEDIQSAISSVNDRFKTIDYN